MDFRPESVTLGSVETTVFLDNEARTRNNAGSGIQLRNLGESVFGDQFHYYIISFPAKFWLQY